MIPPLGEEEAEAAGVAAGDSVTNGIRPFDRSIVWWTVTSFSFPPQNYWGSFFSRLILLDRVVDVFPIKKYFWISWPIRWQIRGVEIDRSLSLLFYNLDFLLKIIMPSKSFWLLLLLLSRLSVWYSGPSSPPLSFFFSSRRLLCFLRPPSPAAAWAAAESNNDGDNTGEMMMTVRSSDNNGSSADRCSYCVAARLGG